MIGLTIDDGPMPTSRMPGCSRFTRPGKQRDGLDEETTNWRAVCGKTARTVRRAGSAKADPDPYHGHRIELEGDTVVASALHNFSLKLWVPAFAGTTPNVKHRARVPHRTGPSFKQQTHLRIL